MDSIADFSIAFHAIIGIISIVDPSCKFLINGHLAGIALYELYV